MWSTHIRFRQVHVMPEDDLITHEFKHTCACFPKVDRITANDGFAVFIVTHNSLDGRELSE